MHEYKIAWEDLKADWLNATWNSSDTWTMHEPLASVPAAYMQKYRMVIVTNPSMTGDKHSDTLP